MYTLFENLVVGASLLIILYAAGRGLWRKFITDAPESPSAPAKPTVTTDALGHPIRPFVEIQKGLHEPPAGFVWELGRRIAEDGESFVVLRLLNLSSVVVDEYEASLEYHQPGSTFASYYESLNDHYAPYMSLRESRDKEKVQFARKHIVHPVTEWSRRMVSKHGSEAGLVDVVHIG